MSSQTLGERNFLDKKHFSSLLLFAVLLTL